MAEAISFTDTADPNVLCPTTGDVCSARAYVVSMYTEAVDRELEQHLPSTNRAHLDRMKMNVKLIELTTRAEASGCEGMVEEKCPVREVMNESTARKTAVRGIRGILRKNK